MSARRTLGCRSRATLVAIVLLAGGVTTACQHAVPGSVYVRSVTFHGNRAFSASQLKSVIVTRAGGWLPWSRKPLFNRARFEGDLDRVAAFYHDRGYPDAHVTDVHTDLSEDGSTVRLTMVIEEGEPILVEQLDWTGFDALPSAERAPLDHAGLAVGGPYDVDRLRASVAAGVRALRNNGYAHATVSATDRTGSRDHRVVVTLAATPGPRATFGPVTIVGLNDVHESVVRRALLFRPGDLFEENRLTITQRRLSTLAVFQFVHVAPDPNAPATAAVVPIVVSVAENRPTKIAFGIGYGSEEHARGSLVWSEANLFGSARELTATGKYSSILRGASLAYDEPALMREGISVSGDVHAWWTSEDTYTARQEGGTVSVRHRFGQSPPGSELRTRNEIRASYIHDFDTFAIKPADLSDLTNFAERIALGLDPITGQGRGTLAAVALDFDSSTLDAPNDPRRGYLTTVHLEHATPGLGGTFQFDEVMTEGRMYVPVTSSSSLAMRARFGSIAAASSSTIPFSERFFLGGATSLRGWGRYEVSPLSAAGLPIGGRSLFEASVEYRFLGTGPLGAAVFIDAGDVGSDPWRVDFDHLKYDAGVGVRYRTPVGIARADFGYELTPTPLLLVNGVPNSRLWRVHFSIGQAF